MQINQRGFLKTALGWVVIGVIAFLIGQHFGQRSMLAGMSIHMDSVQASLTFNRLLDERRWKALLEKGCVAQATKAIDVAEDKDMELLAGFFQGQVDESTVKYISDREPQLLSQLESFKSKYGKSWSEDECKS